jgi:hypothetical protein
MGGSGETNPSRGFWKLIFSAVALLCTLPRCAKSPGNKPAQIRRPHRDQGERQRGGSETASKRQ